MVYEKQAWENSPSTATPISAARLNHIEDGIAAALPATEATATYVPINNMAGAYFPRWRRALARAVSGVADARVLLCSDSTGFGVGGAVPTRQPSNNWLAKMSRTVDARFTPAALGFAGSFSALSTDNRWALGANWSAEVIGNGINGTNFKSATPGGTLTFTPGDSIAYDSFDVWFINTGNSAAFTIQATGGSVVTVTPVATAGMYKATCTAGSAGTGNAVVITATGTTRIMGAEPFHSTVRRVRFGNASLGGVSAVGMAAAGAYSPRACITAVAPDLTIFDLGINDAANDSGANAYLNNLQALITTAKLSGDVLLKTFVPSGGDSALMAREVNTILPAIRSLSASNGVGLVDTHSRWVSYAVSNPLGYYNDTLHPSDQGYTDEAIQLYAALTSI